MRDVLRYEPPRFSPIYATVDELVVAEERDERDRLAQEARDGSSKSKEFTEYDPSSADFEPDEVDDSEPPKAPSNNARIRAAFDLGLIEAKQIAQELHLPYNSVWKEVDKIKKERASNA